MTKMVAVVIPTILYYAMILRIEYMCQILMTVFKYSKEDVTRRHMSYFDMTCRVTVGTLVCRTNFDPYLFKRK